MSENDAGGGASSPLHHYSGELNALESRALTYLRSRSPDALQLPLDDEARAELRTIRNRAVIWAALSGTASGLIIGGLETYLRLVIIGDDDSGMLDHPGIWAAFYAFVGVLTVIEIAFLYWVSLSAISRIRKVIGDTASDDSMAHLIKTGLARSALEVPNPHTEIYGVDPYMLVPRWRLLIWNLLYKAKVGATSILLRVFMRRVLSRAILRGYIPLLAIPLYAGWNAFIIWRVMAEARLRALGPFAVDQAVTLVTQSEGKNPLAAAALHGAGHIISLSADAHPNYVLLLSQMLEQSGSGKDEIETDIDRFWSEIDQLEPDAQRSLAEFAMIVAVLAGRPTRAQIKFVADLHEKTGLAFDAGRLAENRRLVLDGLPLTKS